MISGCKESALSPCQGGLLIQKSFEHLELPSATRQNGPRRLRPRDWPTSARLRLSSQFQSFAKVNLHPFVTRSRPRRKSNCRFKNQSCRSSFYHDSTTTSTKRTFHRRLHWFIVLRRIPSSGGSSVFPFHYIPLAIHQPHSQLHLFDFQYPSHQIIKTSRVSSLLQLSHPARAIRHRL